MLNKNIFISLKNNLLYIVIFFTLLISACQSSIQEHPQQHPYPVTQDATTSNAMAVSAHPLATRVGLSVLKKGGNAIDASIAIQFALAVVYPRAGNIGGGGFMVVRTSEGEYASLDYREKAPKLGSRDMYLNTEKNVIPNLSRIGHLAVGVPGTVDGLIKAHEKYGQLEFAELIQPAIDLASKGYKLSPKEVNRLNKTQEDFRKHNTKMPVFVREKAWQVGDLLVQEDLAQTLTLIRDNGRAGFYEGSTADKIIAEMKAGKGIISYEDLLEYESKWRTPIIGDYKNYKIISMPPPSSGGIALMQLLKLVEPYPLSKDGFHSVDAIHTMVEAERRVYADRAKHLGDSDFYPVPHDSLLEASYLLDRMADFSRDSATRSESIAAGAFEVAMESFETTHTSVVDKDGNAVSLTTTLNGNYGSKVVVSDAGFLLNNEMDDFSAKPGVPNMYGLIGNEANAIQPGKRMLSSMTPTIIEKDGQLHLVLGAPGGSTIITAVFQVFLNVAEFNMSLEEAVWASRFHHQWLPDQIMYEKDGLDNAVKKALEEKGHTLNERAYLALIKAIQVLPNGDLQGVGDNRSEDHAEGY